MKLGRLALATLVSAGFAASAFAGNGSNFQQLLNGEDFFYGGKENPLAPVGTHGVWRCFPDNVLDAPTMVANPLDLLVGTYAAKICGWHFTGCASTGITAVWPTMAFSSNVGDCRFLAGANFGFASSAPLFGVGGLGWMVVGPTAAGAPNLLAAFGNITFGGPFTATPTGATVYGLNLTLVPTPGFLSTIAVPAGENLTYWISEALGQSAGNYMYWTASEDERGACSSLSFIASAITGTGGGGPTGFSRKTLPNREWGMFIATEDATLMACTSPNAAPLGGVDTNQAGVNPLDTGTGGLRISLTGLGGTANPENLSFAHYDEFGPFSSVGGKLMFANLEGLNVQGLPTCGKWDANYLGLPTGGDGGPTLSTLIPQNPRLTGQLDTLAITLISNPLWTALTTHGTVAGGINYPMFGNFAAAGGGSTGNTGGFAIPLPNNPILVGLNLYWFGAALNASQTAIAKLANDGQSHTNGYGSFFFP